MEKLFLLKPDFQDINQGNENKFVCMECAALEGLLSYYPRLRNELEVYYVDFARPRLPIIELIGEANQNCPVLILDDGRFINQPDEIVWHLTLNYHIGQSH